MRHIETLHAVEKHGWLAANRRGWRGIRALMDITGNTVLVTGGSSGIGLAIARQLVAHGNHVTVMGRSADKLAKVKVELPAVDTLACDTSDEDAARRAVDQLASQHPGFNILINAAGVSSACRFATDDRAIAIARTEINTNLMGTVIMTKLALDHFQRDSRPAAIVTISSGIALAPHRSEPTHSATKAALHAFCICLRAQLAGTHVKVIEVMPPITDTEATKAYTTKKASPDAVAHAVVRGIAKNRKEVRIGIVKALGFLVRISPSLASRVVTSSGQIES